MSGMTGWMVRSAVALLLWHGNTVFAQQNGPAVGQTSPNLIGRTLAEDKLYRLSSDKSGPKVINFFWVECHPCKTEMPELARFEKAYPKVKFLFVHARDEKREVVDKFVKSLPAAPSTIILASGAVQETFQIMGLPHTVVMDRNNVVVANLVGYTPENMKNLKKMLEELSR